MRTKQAVAVLGASGEMGSAIARSIAKGNYRILLHSDDRDKVQLLIHDLKADNPSADVEAVDCSFEACWEADVIIPAVPYRAEKQVANKNLNNEHNTLDRTGNIRHNDASDRVDENVSAG